MSRSAMTLAELLVALGVMAILAALALGAFRGSLQPADRSVASGNLRQIGVAIINYAADNGGNLPGPMWPGQIPVIDPARSGRLVRDLAPFLGLGADVVSGPVDLFIPPAYRRVSTDLTNARTFVVNMLVPSAGTTINPWGNLAAGGGDPMRLVAVPSRVWAVSDADQEHPHVSGAPWAGNTPFRPIHDPRRMALTFGGSVVFPETAEFAKP